VASVTFDGTEGPQAVPIGTAITLSNGDGWTGVARALWQLFVPPGSAAALDVPGGWQIAPFTNGFTPDVPGVYRAELTTMALDGSMARASGVATVAFPFVLDAGQTPATGETTEQGASGWTDPVDLLLQRAARIDSDAQLVTFLNGTGSALAEGVVVTLTEQRRWPDVMGGAPVTGAPLDYIAEAVGDVGLDRLVLVVQGGADGERCVGLRRGVIAIDATSWGLTPGTLQTIYLDDFGLPPTATQSEWPLGRAVAGAADADPGGYVYWDPATSESAGRTGAVVATLADNTAVATSIPGLSWDAAAVAGVSIKACVRRAGRSFVTTLVGAVDNSVPEFRLGATFAVTTTSPGVTLSGAVVAGRAVIQFTSTSMGSDAEATFIVEQAWKR